MTAATENLEEVKANLIIKSNESKPQTKFCHRCGSFWGNYVFASGSSRFTQTILGSLSQHAQTESQPSVSLGALTVPRILPPPTPPQVSLHSFTCSYKSQECLKIHLANPHILNTSAFTEENAFLPFTLLIIKCLVSGRQKDKPKCWP